MTRPVRVSLFALRPLMVLLSSIALGHSLPARADTVCVTTVSEFIVAYEDADDEDMTINVVAGTYAFATNPGLTVAYAEDLTIVGGWNSNCTSRQLDPRLTVFTGGTERIAFNSDESIRFESIAVVAEDAQGLLAHRARTTEDRNTPSRHTAIMGLAGWRMQPPPEGCRADGSTR